MGSTHSVSVNATAVDEQTVLPQSHTTGHLAAQYEKLQNARPLYEASSLPQRSNSVRSSVPPAPPPSAKLNLNARIKKFATVAVTRLGLKQARSEGKSQKKVPLSQSFSQTAPPAPAPPAEDPPDVKPRLTELEQIYQDMNIITRVNKSNVGLLLKAFGRYVVKLCAGMCLKPTAPEVAKWVIAMDKSLQDCRWTNKNFVVESHVVFLFMLMERYARDQTFLTIRDVKESVFVCLFISYTYNANEISYPARPFLCLGQDRNKFFQECVSLGLSASGEMLEINQEPEFYRRCLARLLTYA